MVDILKNKFSWDKFEEWRVGYPRLDDDDNVDQCYSFSFYLFGKRIDFFLFNPLSARISLLLDMGHEAPRYPPLYQLMMALIYAFAYQFYFYFYFPGKDQNSYKEKVEEVSKEKKSSFEPCGKSLCFVFYFWNVSREIFSIFISIR